MVNNPKFRFTFTRVIGNDGRVHVSKELQDYAVLYLLNPRELELDEDIVREVLDKHDLSEEMKRKYMLNMVKPSLTVADEWGVKVVDNQHRIYVKKKERGNYVKIIAFPEYTKEELEEEVREKIFKD